MKTDHDLLEELIRLMFEKQGAKPEQIKLMLAQMRQSFEYRPARPLTDAEYSAKLEQGKQEMPAFEAFLLSQTARPLPPRHKGQNN